MLNGCTGEQCRAGWSRMSFERKCNERKKRRFAVYRAVLKGSSGERVRKQFSAGSCSAFETGRLPPLIDTFSPFLPAVRQLERLLLFKKASRVRRHDSRYESPPLRKLFPVSPLCFHSAYKHRAKPRFSTLLWKRSLRD